MSGRLSDVELVSLRSDTSLNPRREVEAFPAFYRRENAPGSSSTSKEYDARKSSTELRIQALRIQDDDVGNDRVQYAPMPESRKLGYFSTAALIVSKMIGTGIFVKPAVVLENCGGRGVSLFLWVGCGLMSLAGCASSRCCPGRFGV
jgi:hypothetical protein